jgi:hypothetical protein
MLTMVSRGYIMKQKHKYFKTLFTAQLGQGSGMGEQGY